MTPPLAALLRPLPLSFVRYTAVEYLLAKLCAELPVDAAVGASFGYIVHSACGFAADRHVCYLACPLLYFPPSALSLSISLSLSPHSHPTADRNVVAGVLALVSCAASSLGLAVGALVPQGATIYCI